MKTCTKCSTSKEVSEFHKRTASPDGLAPWCKSCYKTYDAQSYTKNRVKRQKQNQEWLIAHREQTLDRIREYRKASPETFMVIRARKRAKQQGLECTITKHDVHIPDLCPVLGIPLYQNWGVRGATPNSPSLDRIDNSKGYIPDNIQVISHLANAMKNGATEEQLMDFAMWVIETYG